MPWPKDGFFAPLGAGDSGFIAGSCAASSAVVESEPAPLMAPPHPEAMPQTESALTEIRWHARGGQGAVTAAKMVAELALGQGKYFQAFPEYGPERSGAPIVAFTRVSDEPIQIYCGHRASPGSW